MPTLPMRAKPRGLALRLALSILASACAIFLAVFAYTYRESERTVLRNVEEGARNLTLATVYRMETVMAGAEKLPAYVARRLETTDLSKDDLQAQILDALETNQQVYGSTIAFEPYAANPEQRYFAPYCCRGQDGQPLAFNYLGSETYNYFHMDWYLLPKVMGRPSWSEPYFDENGGKVVMTTYSHPFYKVADGARAFAGVVTADLSLQWLRELVSSISFNRSGHAFLISQAGVFITHPNEQLVMRESIFSVAEATGDKDLRVVGRSMIAGGSGFTRISNPVLGSASGPGLPEDAWLYYAPLQSTGWSLGVLVPEAELFADLQGLSRKALIMGGAGLALMLFVLAAISKAIVRPLEALAHSAATIAQGNLDTALPPVRRKDEIGELRNSFESMRQALKEHIATLVETTAAKERLDSELKIARTIQMSFLPKRFPPFPDRNEFSIFAFLEPAKEVGGDLYDFFLRDENHLFFVIGDVSDKGVPAALFMAVTKTLIKGVAEGGTEPSDILEKVNLELCRDNESMMFVTVICGSLNLASGELLLANAGHGSPLRLRQGAVERLPLPQGLVLGVMEDARYTTQRTKLQPGDMLVLYTDGVTEAMDGTNTLYSEERLEKTLLAHGSDGSEQLVRAVLADVRAHTTGEPQSDDITLLALEYRGKRT
ncbi:serine phosphatase RsbU, regulator of sigma subunit [Desulfocurvibacter africanus PCS]|uniref:Serine phosphatase RsbU, regulator of sigma subunit n=2 Tax=Desulfocurvibacter africanus TaxID=873 RepID=M5Q1Z7_DESAF|nr:serine phosphatase RsbU, regulator of sigma subunit [Desulfocurvibacter africanus PCS]